MAAYFFASPVDVDVKLEGEDDRKKVEIKGEKEKMISCPVYYDGESVAGQVRLRHMLYEQWNGVFHRAEVYLTWRIGHCTCTRWKEAGA